MTVVELATTSPHALLDDLSYRCYCFNRERTPTIDPWRWRLLFPEAERYEARYQAEMRVN